MNSAFDLGQVSPVLWPYQHVPEQKRILAAKADHCGFKRFRFVHFGRARSREDVDYRCRQMCRYGSANNDRSCASPSAPGPFSRLTSPVRCGVHARPNDANREAELETPSRVVCSELWLDGIIVTCLLCPSAKHQPSVTRRKSNAASSEDRGFYHLTGAH